MPKTATVKAAPELLAATAAPEPAATLADIGRAAVAWLHIVQLAERLHDAVHGGHSKFGPLVPGWEPRLALMNAADDLLDTVRGIDLDLPND